MFGDDIVRYGPPVGEPKQRVIGWRNYRELTHAEIVKDLNEAWDRIKKAEKDGREKDREIAVLKKQLDRERGIRKVLSWILGTATASSFVALVKAFLH